jgi:serine/arginine repetitive matrix protein 2
METFLQCDANTLLSLQPQRVVPSATSASASLAASQAFLKDRGSNPNLSNAAAAAALRTHVTTPTPVGETITKRMVRRNSASSNGSAAIQHQQRPGVLQRQSSSGSMTERTFRSPSPGRSSPPDPDAPPVPAVPKIIPQTSAVHRRASSLEPAYRGKSPTPRGGGRGASLDRGAGPTTGGRGQRVSSHLAQVAEDDQDAGQRGSVNYSRPMSPASAARSGWFGGPVVNRDAVQKMASTSRPNTSSGLASTDFRSVQRTVQNAANRPVSLHQVSRGVEGSRLGSGSMRAKPSGAAVESRSFLQQTTKHASGPVDPKSPDAVFDPSTRTFVHKQDAMARHRELQEPEQPSQHYVAQHLEEHYPPHVPQPRPRTPSPVRQPARREESPAVQRREAVPAPPLDVSTNTSTRIRRPEDPPIGLPTHDQATERALQQHDAEEFADADAQPLKHFNSSRELETSVQPTPIDVMVSPKFAANQDSAYPRMATPVIPSTTNSLAEQGLGSAYVGRGRGSSLSPPRNAHFAPVAIQLAGVKHQPPPRSISPAKSALKSSPSVSRRGTSPVSQNGHLFNRSTASDVSDTMSDTASKKKPKSIRVSFEEAPIVAGTSAHAEPQTSPTSLGLFASKWSPKAEKENEFEDFMKPRPALPLFGSIREKEKRPAHESGVAEKVTETVSSTPMSASVGSIGESLRTSNDHAIAGIVAQDHANKLIPMNDPLPPEVTSVEGSGYVSDSSDEADRSAGMQKHGSLDDSSQILSVPEPKSLTAAQDGKSSAATPFKSQDVEVPEIALLPATPLEHPEPKYQSMFIPGGWGEDVPDMDDRQVSFSEPITKPSQSTTSAIPTQHPTSLHDLVTQNEDSSDDNSSVYSDAYEDLEGGFASIDALMDSPVASSTSGLMFSRHADNSTIEPTSSGLRNETALNESPPPVTTPAKDWDATRQYWSGLSEARKQPQTDKSEPSSQAEDVARHVMAAPVKQEQPRAERQIESQLTPIKAVPPTSQPQTPQSASKPLKSALKKSAVAQPAPAQQSQPHIRKTMRGPASRDDRAPEPQMRTSMRGPPGRDARSAEPQMRKSMRTAASPSPREQPQMRTSMRGANAAPMASMGLAASRHSMPPVEQKPPRAALQKKHIPAGAVAAQSRPQSMPAAIAKATAPVPTYDSDSDGSASSFQKARGRRAGNQNNRYTMRASMRQDDAPTMRAAAPAPKKVRAISPPGSPAPALRKSLQPSSPTPDPPKSSKFSIRSLSPMGRFRSSKPIEAPPPMPTPLRKAPAPSKQAKPKAPVVERAKPAFMSRFADSSDEDDDSRPSRFQSRFNDSDDEDAGNYALPLGLTPVRGIPRKAGEEDGDSTDLEEEADETPVPAATSIKDVGPSFPRNGSSSGHTNGTTNGQGAILAAGSLRDSKHAPLPVESKSKAKRGFFGLGKKKTASSYNEPVGSSAPLAVPATASQPTNTPIPEVPLPPQRINRDQGLPLTPIDEDKDFSTPLGGSPETKRSPKLQRRSTPEWPLPHNNIPVPPIPDDARPMSSDGIAPRRPRFAMRQSSQMSRVSTATAPSGDFEGRSVSFGRSGKKKKFQGLRRVFGIND